MLVTPGMYLPYNWRTPAMVPYDVQAHPFNRAPNASPAIAATTRPRYAAPRSETEVTGGSSRSSVWSVELEPGSCGCLSGYDLLILFDMSGETDGRIWQYCFGRGEGGDTFSDG